MAKLGPLSGQPLAAGKYQLNDLLGSGGMGAVYKAQDTRLNRPVAVKVLSPQGPVSAADLQQFTQLFQAEALRLASLKHPSIPHIYDHFDEAGRWFLVMEFIEGESLESYLAKRGGRLPVYECCCDKAPAEQAAICIRLACQDTIALERRNAAPGPSGPSGHSWTWSRSSSGLAARRRMTTCAAPVTLGTLPINGGRMMSASRLQTGTGVGVCRGWGSPRRRTWRRYAFSCEFIRQGLRVRSLVGLIPLLAVETVEPAMLKQLPGFKARLEWFLKNRPHLASLVSRWQEPGMGARHLLALVRGHRMKRLLKRMLDPDEFLSPYGVRSLSRYHAAHPYELQVNDATYTVRYEPAESRSGLFGGNSNWRGPIWFPINYLLIESLQKFYRYYGNEFKVECPTGSGQYLTLDGIADDLSHRLIALFLRDEQGRRPFNGGSDLLQADPHCTPVVAVTSGSATKRPPARKQNAQRGCQGSQRSSPKSPTATG